MAKILLIVAILVSLGTAGISYVNRGEAKKIEADLAMTKSMLASTKGEFAGAQKEVATLTENLDASTAAKTQAETDLAAARAQAQKVAVDIASATTAADEARGQLAALNVQIEEKDRTIAELSSATTSAPVATETVDNARLSELEAMNSSLQAKLTDSDSQLTSLKRKEDDRAGLKMREGLEGRVLAVNPAWNFVVLSIGDRNGVVNNAELLLKRGSQYLGKVRVTSVEPSTSIADIVANSLPVGVFVQPGDSVIFSSSAN
jgi:chromosome segregation ATPase